MHPNQQWEYMSRYFNNVGSESLVHELNACGADGWELIHIEPIYTMKDGHLVLPTSTAAPSDTCFCVFKRSVQKPS